jgi:HPt (histidine-containing phosphotransfer) domain-containing protein
MRYDLALEIIRRKEMTLIEPNASKAVFNLAQALTVTGGDTEMLESIVELFAVEGPKQLDAIRVHVERHDTIGIQRSAHQFKGSVVIFGAARAESAALKLEHAAVDGDQLQIAQAWSNLTDEFARLMTELKGTFHQQTCFHSIPNGLPSKSDPGDDAAVGTPHSEGPLE